MRDPVEVWCDVVRMYYLAERGKRGNELKGARSWSPEPDLWKGWVQACERIGRMGEHEVAADLRLVREAAREDALAEFLAQQEGVFV